MTEPLTVIARARAKPGEEAALEAELQAVLLPTHMERYVCTLPAVRLL